MIHQRALMVLVMLSFSTAIGQARADEGMWAFSKLPLEQLRRAYGFEPPPGWVEHLRTSAVRFNNGGSGSFVSANGLIMTNHHVAADTLSKVSTADKDYYKDGFLARSTDQEIPAPDLELNVLVDSKDVTDKVNAAVNARHGRRRSGHGTTVRDGFDREGGIRSQRTPQ